MVRRATEDSLLHVPDRSIRLCAIDKARESAGMLEILPETWDNVVDRLDSFTVNISPRELCASCHRRARCLTSATVMLAYGVHQPGSQPKAKLEREVIVISDSEPDEGPPQVTTSKLSAVQPPDGNPPASASADNDVSMELDDPPSSDERHTMTFERHTEIQEAYMCAHGKPDTVSWLVPPKHILPSIETYIQTKEECLLDDATKTWVDLRLARGLIIKPNRVFLSDGKALYHAMVKAHTCGKSPDAMVISMRKYHAFLPSFDFTRYWHERCPMCEGKVPYI
ncbi:hypothetical protein OF83DRAFT_457528 [Amylostereum chailletii]|nr:hypothetical protein OF83DRAFT_457528 [Amylostereum chailletii]